MSARPPLELNPKDLELVASLVGRTIVAAEWFDATPDGDWDERENCNLTLDDGRVINFGAWFYDAGGATIGQVHP